MLGMRWHDAKTPKEAFSFFHIFMSIANISKGKGVLPTPALINNNSNRVSWRVSEVISRAESPGLMENKRHGSSPMQNQCDGGINVTKSNAFEKSLTK